MTLVYLCPSPTTAIGLIASRRSSSRDRRANLNLIESTDSKIFAIDSTSWQGIPSYPRPESQPSYQFPGSFPVVNCTLVLVS